MIASLTLDHVAMASRNRIKLERKLSLKTFDWVICPKLFLCYKSSRLIKDIQSRYSKKYKLNSIAL